MEFLQASSLTTGLDIGVTGTSGNDTFTALDGDPALATGDPSTVQAGDEIDGGDGTDTLVWTATPNAAGTAVVGASNVEGLKIYNNTNNDAYSIDANMMSGITDIYAMGGNATTTVTNTGLVNVHMISTSENVTVTKKATVGLGTSDAVTILGNNAATTSSATVDYDGAETVNLVAAGAIGSATRTLTITNDDLETLNITGDAAVNVTTTFTGAAASTQTATLDASEAGGVVRATVTRGASSKSAITLSDNNDHLTMVSAISKDDVLVGGDGTDILETGDTLTYSSTATAQEGAGISGFETLRLQTGGSVDMRALTGDNDITTVVYEATGSVTKSAGITAISQLAAGTATLALATDGAADEITTTVGSSLAAGGVVATLAAADMETINVVSAGLTTDNTLTLSGATADVTTVNVSGRGIDLTVAGTSVATVDASGVAGLGSAFTLDASASEADMTVTGSSVVPTDTDNDTADNITTGEGDDTITTGEYNDVIVAGDGANTVDAGDGDNNVTTGRHADTITVGDGDNTIVSGIGNDTVTVGGTATSVNSINLGNGDDTLVSGAGIDTVTLGAGDDNVSTGGGADKIYMSDYDDDDVINGGAGTDTLSVSALASSTDLAGAQIQAENRFVDVTPGASRTSTPQFTGVESVYMQVHVDDDNDEGTAATNETVSFASSSGITNLYLEINDDNTDGGNEQGKLTLSEIDASAIHLVDRGTGDDLGELVVVGDGQASLTLKGHDFDGGTDLTVSDVDAVTFTSYQSNATVAVGDSSYGDVEADDAGTVTATMAGTTAALAGSTLTLNSLSADGATAINFNAGSNNTLAVTGSVTSTSDALDTMAIVVSDDGTMTVGGDIESTGAEMTSATITIGVAGSLTVTDQIDLESAEDVTVTVGAAGTFDINDFVVGGDVVINATMGSSVTIDTFGESGITGTFDINGRGTLVNAFAIDGDTTVNIAGWTDTVAGGFTVTTTGNDDMTFVSNNDAITLTAGNGDNVITTGTAGDTITTGSGADEISSGAGDDTITSGAGIDDINAGAGDDTITGGAGADTIAGGTGADLFTLAANADFGDVISDFETGSDRLAIDINLGTQSITAMTTAATTLTGTTMSSAITATPTATSMASTTAAGSTTAGIFGAAFVGSTNAITATASATFTTTVTLASGVSSVLTNAATATATTVLGGVLNVLTDSGTGTIAITNGISASNSVALSTAQVFTFTGTGTAAFKAAVVAAQTGLATGTAAWAVFGLGGDGTVFLANATNTATAGLTSSEITSVRTIAKADGITATDIVLI